MLDAAGCVTAANTSARKLWQAGEAELVGDAFASLFAFEVVSNDPEFLEAQWDVVLASALDRSANLTAQPREGAPCDVRVRIEKLTAAASGYVATVQPPAIRAPASATAGPDDELAAGFRLLAEKGAAGFFDLNLKGGRVQFAPVWTKMI